MIRTDNPWSMRWLTRVEQWQHRAADAGLLGVMTAIQEGLRPLAPLAAQLLWVAQPTFRLFGETDAIEALAALLNDPAQCEAETAPHSDLQPTPESR